MFTPVIGIVAHTRKAGAGQLTRILLDDFVQRELSVELETETAAAAGVSSGHPTKELGNRCDLIVVLGGDGTMLRAVQELEDNQKPIFGINLGSLGFLTCVSSKDYPRAVEAIASGKYEVSQRSLLQIQVIRDGTPILERTGLNDAVITRGEISRLIRLRARIDGKDFTEYNADGLIVATPTGSTAYSLSAGGPVMMPSSGVFVITPICPHVLTNRSLVVGDHSEIEISSCPREQFVALTVDGQECMVLRPDDTVRIRRAAHSLALAALPDFDFLTVLRQKLKWSGTAIEEQTT